MLVHWLVTDVLTLADLLCDWDSETEVDVLRLVAVADRMTQVLEVLMGFDTSTLFEALHQLALAHLHLADEMRSVARAAATR